MVNPTYNEVGGVSELSAGAPVSCLVFMFVLQRSPKNQYSKQVVIPQIEVHFGSMGAWCRGVHVESIVLAVVYKPQALPGRNVRVICPEEVQPPTLGSTWLSRLDVSN